MITKLQIHHTRVDVLYFWTITPLRSWFDCLPDYVDTFCSISGLSGRSMLPQSMPALGMEQVQDVCCISVFGPRVLDHGSPGSRGGSWENSGFLWQQAGFFQTVQLPKLA